LQLPKSQRYLSLVVGTVSVQGPGCAFLGRRGGGGGEGRGLGTREASWQQGGRTETDCSLIKPEPGIRRPAAPTGTSRKLNPAPSGTATLPQPRRGGTGRTGAAFPGGSGGFVPVVGPPRPRRGCKPLLTWHLGRPICPPQTKPFSGALVRPLPNAAVAPRPCGSTAGSQRGLAGWKHVRGRRAAAASRAMSSGLYQTLVLRQPPQRPTSCRCQQCRALAGAARWCVRDSARHNPTGSWSGIGPVGVVTVVYLGFKCS